MYKKLSNFGQKRNLIPESQQNAAKANLLEYRKKLVELDHRALAFENAIKELQDLLVSAAGRSLIMERSAPVFIPEFEKKISLRALGEWKRFIVIFYSQCMDYMDWAADICSIYAPAETSKIGDRIRHLVQSIPEEIKKHDESEIAKEAALKRIKSFGSREASQRVMLNAFMEKEIYYIQPLVAKMRNHDKRTFADAIRKKFNSPKLQSEVDELIKKLT